MTLFHALIIVAVGLVAGMVNTIVGSGSLLTFPTLLALGYPPVLANVSNTVGLISGSLSGAVGYRRELKGQLRRILALLPAVVLGTVIGASLLLALPGSAFRRVVPILILFAVALVLVQPTVARRRAERGAQREHPGPLLQVGTFLTSIYGGYFGAAQGVVLLGLFGITLDDDFQRLNAAKNVIAATINAVGAVFFIVTTTIAWEVAGLLFVGSTVGGQIGAVVGRRLSPQVLRATIAIVGTAVAIKLLV
ncbi:MAG TPA: sulfite exporter TauE/SafE family protein [Mycobacteriales bacterium]|nr:sulfite exporter TauE/SafE family protein [Mycobacteriales bacterium]